MFIDREYAVRTPNDKTCVANVTQAGPTYAIYIYIRVGLCKVNQNPCVFL